MPVGFSGSKRPEQARAPHHSARDALPEIPSRFSETRQLIGHPRLARLYSLIDFMDVFGITGGIGMGKSTAGDLLQRLGVSVVDTDQLARDVVAPGSPGLADVVREFGPEFLDVSGALRREALGQRVFADPAALARLNALLHPRIRAAWRSQLETWRHAGVSLAAVTIPLLFEQGYGEEFQWIVCMACTETTQRLRLRDRGWSDTETARRCATQLSPAEKMARAQHVVWTEGSRHAHGAQWERLLSLRAPLFNGRRTV